MFATGDTIAAPATSTGGALALIRISGPDALTICDKCFKSPSGKTLVSQKGYTAHFGNIVSPTNGEFIDEVLITIFRSPHSYTGEDMAEISCHGSRWIVAETMRALVAAGARTAEAGEFTARAFLAGKLDLAQAEAVADMIASGNRTSHALASAQLRGHYSAKLSEIRNELLRLASLLELELDFSEEDVTFADRTELDNLLTHATSEINRLSSSFSLGNAIKVGIPVAIIGKPNAGKSTLLNCLAGEDRAMVSDIAGTTRDTIEETININGMGFRFTDTAGLRESDDCLERMGIERTHKALSSAHIILYLADCHEVWQDIISEVQRLNITSEQRIAILLNKCDNEKLLHDVTPSEYDIPVIRISAKYGLNIDALKCFLSDSIDTAALYSGDAVVSNARHYESLQQAATALATAREALNTGLPSDLIAEDLRHVLDAIGAITGEITSTDILNEIFSKFCVGK